MIKCRNCSKSSLSVSWSREHRKRGLLLPLLVFLAITGSFFVEVDSVMEKERAGQQVKVQLSRDEAQSALQSVEPAQSQSQPQLAQAQEKQQPQQQQALPPTLTTSDISNTYKINSNTNTETVKIGNSKTKNYNFQESNYLPTQLTQVVLNVPKTHSRILRRTRPPTVDEFMIKRKILDVYEEAGRELSGALGEGGKEVQRDSRSANRFNLAGADSAIKAANGQQSLYFNQLGRILQALNPKYIATERVRDAAFADPTDPNAPVQPADVPPQLLALDLSLDGLEESAAKPLQVSNLLLDLEDRFRSQVNWDQSFIEALMGLADEQLEPAQVAFKKLILCLNDPLRCGENENYLSRQHEVADAPRGNEQAGEEAYQVEQDEEENEEDDDGEQQGLVYATNDNVNPQTGAYDPQPANDNLGARFGDNYEQFSPAEHSPPFLQQSPSPSPPPQANLVEPARFRARPPPYGIQNDRAYNQFEPRTQVRVPTNGWPDFDTRQTRVLPQPSNNANRFDALRNRYQFQPQQQRQQQQLQQQQVPRYTYQRPPPQKQQVVVPRSYS